MNVYGNGKRVTWWRELLYTIPRATRPPYPIRRWAMRRKTNPEITMTQDRGLDIADRIERQAVCLEGYAEASGFDEKPVPSVFHLQASHFRDLARELRTFLEATPITDKVMEEAVARALTVAFEGQGRVFDEGQAESLAQAAIAALQSSMQVK